MLRRLDLWGCSHCTDIGIARVASGGPKLRVLNLGRLHQLTDGERSLSSPVVWSQPRQWLNLWFVWQVGSGLLSQHVNPYSLWTSVAAPR